MFRNNYTNTQPKNTKHLYAMTKYMEYINILLRVPSLLDHYFGYYLNKEIYSAFITNKQEVKVI